MDFNKILFVTDADGTLLNSRTQISLKDRTAINEFINGGGMFTVATGRNISLMRIVADDLKLRLPAIVFNGAAIYDFNADKLLWRTSLSGKARGYIRLFMERFPSLAVEILNGDDTYVVRSNDIEEAHIALGYKSPVRCGFDEVPDNNWIKCLIVGEPDVIDQAIKFSLEQNFTDVHMVRSAPVFYEILPSGIDKGRGLRKLIELMDIRDRYIVAAGDFMNDIEMLETADLAIAVANAEDSVKSAADIIVCDNNSGAMREIVEYLKQLD